MTFEDKAEIVITQLRADRDRLAKALNDIKAEIEGIELNITYAKNHKVGGACWGLRKALDIINKHMAESEVI